MFYFKRIQNAYKPINNCTLKHDVNKSANSVAGKENILIL